MRTVIEEAAAKRGLLVDWGSGMVTYQDEECGSLQNLGARLGSAAESDWANIVNEHFTKTETLLRQVKSLSEMRGSFEACRPLLKIRLHGRGSEWLKKFEPCSREDVPGIFSVLVLDTEIGIVNVTRDNVNAWRRGDPELFRIALDNVQREEALSRRDHAKGELRMTFLTGANPTSASHALFLDQYLDATWRGGYLVSMPDGETIVAHKIEDASAMINLGGIVDVTAMNYDQNPGPISKAVFFWRNGGYEPIKVEGMNIRPGPKLTQALSQFAQDAKPWWKFW
jgi:hypothetical protein